MRSSLHKICSSCRLKAGVSPLPIRDSQEALIDKTVLELGAFPNVYIEIANEFPVNDANVDAVYPWQLAMAHLIGASTPRLVTAHAHEYRGDQVKGVQHYWDQPFIDVLGFHFQTRDSGTLSSLLHTVQTHGMVIQQNEGGDPYLKLSAATQADTMPCTKMTAVGSAASAGEVERSG